MRPSRLGGPPRASALPVPVALGVKDAFARRGRALLTASSLVLSIVVVVAALSMEASFALEDAQSRASIAAIESRPAPFGIGPAWDFFEDQSAERRQFRLIVYGLSGVLLLIALANLLTTALLSVRERVRDVGILKAVGLTPRDVGTTRDVRPRPARRARGGGRRPARGRLLPRRLRARERLARRRRPSRPGGSSR